MTPPASHPTRPVAVAAARGLLALGGLLVGLVAALATPLAQAQANCPAPADGTTPTETLAATLAQLPQCEKNADWLLALGQRLLQAQRFAEAAEHLERALLLQPQSIPAALAYSIALAGSGDLPSALQLLAQLAKDPNAPEPLRQQLAQTQQRITATLAAAAPNNQATGWQRRSSAGVRLGYDSNLLGTPRLNTLTLTLPGGDVSLPVEPGNLPRPGAYQRTDVRTDHAYTSQSGRRTELSAALLYRSSAVAPEANTTQTELVIETQPGPDTPAGPHTEPPIWAMASAASLHTRSGTRYRNLGAGAGWARSHDGCSQRLGAELQHRALLNNTVLSGHYKGLTASWHCTPNTPTHGNNAATWQPSYWQLSARLGTDAPTTLTRPGGRQHQLGLRATARWNSWLLDLDTQLTQDATGYSAILGNNAVRRATRVTLRIEHHTPLPTWGTDTHAVWGVEMFRQRANLDLFKINSINAYMALRKGW